MKPAFSCLLLFAFIGCTQAIYFSSLDAAVKGLPELSLLASQLDIVAPTLAAQLRAPTFVGTLFAPTNDTLGLSTLQPYLKPAFYTTIQDFFGMAVIPGPPLKLSDLVNGAVLTTLNNKSVTVKVTQAADGSGPIYYINGARILGGNVYGGNSIIHETFGLIVPPGFYQSAMNNALAGSTPANPPATKNLSPEGAPQSSPSPSPAALPSPSPTPAAGSPPATTAASPSPSPATVTSPSPSPAGSQSPSPAVVASPSPSPAPAKSPNPSPAASPSPATSNPAPSTTGGSDSGEVINIPQPLPSPSPAPATNSGGDSAIVTESGAKTIPSTTNTTNLRSSTVRSAASKSVAGAMVLIMPAVLGMLWLL